MLQGQICQRLLKSLRKDIYSTLMGSGTKDILNFYDQINSDSDNIAIRIWNYSKGAIDAVSGITKLPQDILVLIASSVLEKYQLN